MVAAICGASGVLIAAVSYRSSVRLKRAEWLQKLYQQYYEQELYRDIRNLLDYGADRELKPIYEHLKNGSCDARVDQLWDYLNFFEFVEGLVHLKQISSDDREYLFGYPLRKIGENERIRKILQSEGFERLHKLFEKRNH